MLKREWGEESDGKLPHIFNPRKTVALVPEFAVWENCSLNSCACSEGPAIGQNTLIMMMMMIKGSRSSGFLEIRNK